MAAQPSGEISALGDQTAPMHVVLFGATGTIGRAVLSRLIEGGHTVTCIVRPGSGAGLPADVSVKECRLAPEAISQAFEGSAVDAVISCLASRSGRAADAWAIDHAAHRAILNAAEAAGVGQMILLSALCVQRPKLAFQRAKLAFEAELRASQLNWSIVRPTAFFKSLSGQVERVQRGKPFLVFGDGRLTAC
ncbi:MAG: NAD(P)H-binding protein, partial [Pseudomonadota bacterium]